MEKDGQDISKRDIKKLNKIDHLRNLIIIGLDFIPSIGGALSILFDKYIPDKRYDRLYRFIESLQNDMESLNINFTKELLKSDEFIEIIEKVFYGVASSSQKEKMESYKSILLNSIKSPKYPSFENKEIYLNMVNELSTAHIKVLSSLYHRSKDGIISGSEQLKGDLENYSPDLLRLIIRDLAGKGLLETSEKWAKLVGPAKSWHDRSCQQFCVNS